jgi:hypothetical protein
MIMSLDQPPIPTRAEGEFPFPSIVHPDITYILKPARRGHVAERMVRERAIAARKRPLTERMREVLLEVDLSPHLTPAEISRAHETTRALQAGALGIPDEDTLFLAYEVEPILVTYYPEYNALAVAEEELDYERRKYSLADLLYAAEEKGDRYTFPEDDIEAKYAYVDQHIDPMDISILYVRSRNLGTYLSPDAVKNSEAPSGSD